MALTEADLAYMREVQADHRPTAATLFRKGTTRTATGGQTAGYVTAGVPVQVRLDGTPDKVPLALGGQYEGATLVKIVMDLTLDVRAGDRVTVSATEGYELITDGDPDRWQTAQVVWARRYLHPGR